MLQDLARDLRYGARLLARSPVFAIVAILSLGIGIGANVSMFSVVDALLLKKLSVPDPDSLVYVVSIEQDVRSSELAFERLERLRDKAPAPFSRLAATWHIERANLSVDAALRDAVVTSLTRMNLLTGDYF